MHIHSGSIGLHPGTYAAANERAAASQRAAEVRKRLLKAGQSPNADATPEETLLISRWLGQPQPGESQPAPPQSQAQAAGSHRSPAEG